MHEHVPAETTAEPVAEATMAAAGGGGLVAEHLLELQRTAGNQAVTRYLEGQPSDTDDPEES